MKENFDNSAERTLTKMAKIILICGITCSALLGLCFIFLLVSWDPAAFIVLPSLVVALFATLVTWSVMKVLANMSMTLKDISKKLDEKSSSDIQ
jgi:CHASE2 domain-containing sensor protein